LLGAAIRASMGRSVMARSPSVVNVRALVLGASMLMGACVSIEDPNHCANKQGDQSCEGAQVCSRCVGSNNGCVDDEPNASCRVDEGDEAATTTGESTGGSGESGPLPDCVGEGMVAECPAEAPYCASGTCSDCTGAGGSEYCAGVDAAKPVCHEGIAACVQCDEGDASACTGETFACDISRFECGGCTEHAQCPDSACDIANGVCLSGINEYWVDAGQDCMMSFGTESEPYCTLAEALGTGNPRLPTVIHVLAGPDITDSVISTNQAQPRTIAILGEGNVRITASPGISVASGSTIYAAGVDLRGSTSNGISCSAGGAVWLDDSRIGDTVAAAVSASSCEVRIRRSQIVGNPGGGIDITTGTNLRLWSSIVGGNGTLEADTFGISAANSTMDIRYATIANNIGTMTEHDSLDCTTSSGSVSDSILLSIGPSVECANVTFAGSYSDTDLGGDNVTGNYDVALFTDAAANDYHVDAGATVLMNVARWELGDPRHDVDGALRGGIAGATDWTGADVP
jgi:hypothetical protein